MEHYFGVPEENVKCRFCEKAPTSFRVGSFEVRGNYIVSWRFFLLCDDHKDREDYEKPEAITIMNLKP